MTTESTSAPKPVQPTQLQIDQAFQLLCFHQTKHPHTSHITQDDLDFATKVSANQKDTTQLYPLEWPESAWKFQNFLRQWRSLYNKPNPSPQLTRTASISAILSPLLGSFSISDSARQEQPESNPEHDQAPLPSDNTHSEHDSSANEHTSQPESSANTHTQNLITEPSSSNTLDSQTPPNLNTDIMPETGTSATMTPEQIAALVSQTVAATMREMNGAGDTDTDTGSVAPTTLKPDDVGYFNPNVRDPEGHGIVSSGKTTIYTNVFAFTHRLKHLAASRGEQAVKETWTICLQNTALHWHSIELTDLEREALADGSLTRITKALENRFKKTKSDALRSLASHVFTLQDLAAGHNMRKFVQQVMADAQACDLPLESQLLWVFESFDSEIQGQLLKPERDTTLQAFCARMDQQESVLISRAHERYPPQRSQNFRRPQQAYYARQSDLPLTNRPPPPDLVPETQPPNPIAPSPHYARLQPQQDQRWQNTYDQARRGSRNYRGRGTYQTRPNFNNLRGGTYGQFQGRGGSRNQAPHWKNNYRQPAYFHDNQEDNGPSFTPDDFNDDDDEHPAFFNDDDDHGYGPGPDEPYDTPEPFQESHEEVVQFGTIVTAERSFTCHCCQDKFVSNNQLHRHIRKNHTRKQRDTSLGGDHCHFADILPAQDEAFPNQADITEQAAHADPVSISQVLSNTPRQPNPQPPKEDVHNPRPYKPRIIKSSIDSRPDIGTGFGLRSWSYLRIQITTSLETMREHDVCADTGCSRSLADKTWIMDNYPNLTIRTRATPMIVKGIGDTTHTSYEYIIMPMYFKGIDKGGSPAIASWRREVTLVNDLQANLLIGMDILGPEKVDISISKSQAILNSCESLRIPLTLKARGKQFRHAKVQAAHFTTLQPYSMAAVPVTHHIPQDGQDLLFEPSINKASAFAALTNADMNFALLCNETAHPISIPARTTIGTLASWDNDSYVYQVAEPGAEEMALRSPYTPGQFEQPQRRQARDTMLALPEYIDDKITHPTGVQIYDNKDNPDATNLLFDLITKYADVFQDKGFVDVPEDEWMRVQLKPGWEKEIPKKTRPYTQGPEEREIIKKTLTELLKQKRAFKTRWPVPFSFPVFVAWRYLLSGERKGRMVVDIRVGNRMALADAYPMKSQEDMLAKLADASFISVMDAISFYHQWRIHPDSWWAFTITTPEGQFTFTCLVMGYKGSNAYVQRQMDRLLAHIPTADSFCDDLAVGSDDIHAHLRHLESVLMVLRRRNIGIGPSKSFIGFPNAVVLGRMVDAFGLTTTKERLKAIAKIKFPGNLRELETFLGMAGYMRHNIPMYAALAEPLERRKTALVATSKEMLGDKKRSKQTRQKMVKKIALETPSDAEIAAFEGIKDALTRHTTLHFFTPNHTLFIDFDVSAHGIGVCVYHVTDKAEQDMFSSDGTIAKYPARTSLKPIAFISRTLSTAEKKYWATEMEIVGFVWALRKTKHWIESSNSKVYILTDHRAIIGLHTQKTDIVNSTAMSVKNKRLIRALEYISQFNIEVIHKPGNLHIIPDALSRLPRTDQTTHPDAPGELDMLPDEAEEHWKSLPQFTNRTQWAIAMMTEPVQGIALPPIKLPAPPPLPEQPLTDKHCPSLTLIEISPDFKQKIQQGYLQENAWKKVLDIIKTNKSLRPEDRADLPFTLRHGLLWKTTHENPNRLCVPKSCFADIFETFHGSNHLGYERLSPYLAHYCLLNGRRELKKYLSTCPECAMFRTRHHKQYGNLQPIIGPPCPYHTITIDIILALPESKEGYNAIMTVTCKMSKEISIIPGSSKWTSRQWGTALIAKLLLNNWGLPKSIISDRDPKFMSDLWASIWKALGTSLLYSTAYKPSTDGQSERTNQMVESALRHYIHSLDSPELWPYAIPRLQFEFNNTRSSVTKMTPNEIVKGFTPNSISDLLVDNKEWNKTDLPISRLEAHDAICTAAMSMKAYFDRRHMPKFFNPGDRVLLRLHKGYNIPKAASLGRKLSQQYAGPFKIIERIGRSAYRLQFPPDWKIHDVISLDHLEPMAFDVFGRYLPYAGPIRTDQHQKRIISTTTTRSGEPKWLIAYDGLGPEYYEWRTTAQLGEESHPLIEQYRSASRH